jgi:carboxylesterase type B
MTRVEQIFSIIFLCLVSQPELLWSSTAPTGSGRQWSTRVVNTKLGAVRGLIFQPKGGYDGVEVFYGLPYATPPVGSLRLMPPVSGSPWSGTKMNEEPGPVCPQVLPNIDNETEVLKVMPKGRLAQLKRLLPLLRNQSEDCLYLNVYVPLSGKDDGQFLNENVFYLQTWF